MPAAASVAPVHASLRAGDDDLVAAVRAGDERAFEALYARYRRRVAGYVRGMVRDEGRSEDVCQEVFISALRRLRETERPIAFKPWIFEIARNACIDAHRRTVRTNEVSFEARAAGGEEAWLTDRRAGPDAAMATKQQLHDLRGAFGGLSPVHREILVLREFEGCSYREIGERLGMSRPAVESTLFRARRRLSEEYDELVSGRQCIRVRELIVAAAGSRLGVRDRRRLARHVAHCQLCRRHALVAGVALGMPAPAAARLAGLLPVPWLLRRRLGGDEPGVLGAHGSTHMATIDPGAFAGWPRAIAAAAAVAVAGLGAGSAVVVERGGAAPPERRAAVEERAPAPRLATVPTVPARAPAPRARPDRAPEPGGTGRDRRAERPSADRSPEPRTGRRRDSRPVRSAATVERHQAGRAAALPEVRAPTLADVLGALERSLPAAVKRAVVDLAKLVALREAIERSPALMRALWERLAALKLLASSAPGGGAPAPAPAPGGGGAPGAQPPPGAAQRSPGDPAAAPQVDRMMNALRGLAERP